MAADYKTPQWLLPNELNMSLNPALSEDRHSLYSMDFNGTDYISAPNTFLNSASVCTLSFWMKGTGEVGGGAPWNGIQIQAGVTTTSFRTMNGSNVNNYVSFSPGTDWHHYLGVYVGGSYSKLYIDGVLKSTLSTGIPATLASTSGDIFKIGYGQSYSVAKIDEVAVWNRQLTDGGVADGVTAGGEIATIYNSGAPGNLMGLSFKPIAYYPLGEQAQMGSANWSFPNGSLQSHAVSFDGSSDYITTPSFTTSGDDLTISVWLKAVNLSSGTSDILFGNNSNFIRYNLNEVIYARINGVDAYLIANSGGVPQIFGTGNWHHLAVVKSGSTVTWYIDGNPYTTLGSGTTGGFTMNYIGANGSALNEFLDGQLSNVAIWNSDQSANIDNIYNNGSPQSTYTATPTVWWKLNAANSSYVYPWSLELNGSPDVSGSGDHAKVVSNALQIQDINTTGTSGKVDFLTREITGAYSGIDVTGEFIVYAASSGQSGATLYYKIDGGSWVQFQQELRTDNTATTYAISGASGLTSTTSFQVKIEFETGNTGTPYVTLNNISIGGLYTEDFTNQDGAGWDNDTYTPPPVDWTFIDTETPAPNYTSALSFDGSSNINTSSNTGTNNVTFAAWIKTTETFHFSLSRCAFGGRNTAAGSNYTLGRLGSYFSSPDDMVVRVFNTYGSTKLNDGKWHHIAYTYDYTSKEVKAYVDGNSTPEVTVTFPGYSTSLDIAIGWNGFDTTYKFTGDVSNCLYYNKILSGAEVTTLYNNGTPEVSPSHSPTGWWKCDNLTTGIQDSVGSNNGTNNGSTQIATNVLISNNGESDTLPTSALTPSDLQFESPYSNYSLSFDGIGNYLNTQSTPLQLGLPATTVTASDFSLSFWYYFDATQNYDPIMQASVSATNGFGVWQSTTNTSSLNFWVGNYSSGSLYTTQLTSGTWYHIGCVFKGGATHTQEIYVNGVLNNTVSYTTSRVIQSGENCLIGGQTFNSRYLSGKLDEIAVWSSALSQDQIIQVYNNGYPANIASLSPTAWWRLGEDAYFVGNDITIPNQISSGQTGTGAGTQTAILVGDAPGSYANGSGTNLVVGDRIGDAPESTANSVSINMIPSNRISYPAGYVPTQVDNVYSMAFDGLNDYFDIGNLQPSTTSLSISAWAYKTDTSQASIIGRGASVDYGIFVYGGSLQFGLNSGSWSTITTSIPTVNTWFHVCATWDGTSMKLYVNGALASSASKTGTITYTSNNTTIGKNSTLSGFEWDGKIDEVALFNYALSERQIKQDIYNGTTTGKTADLNNISNLTAPVAWYRMGD